MNPTPNSKEILQGSPDEKITLRSVEDLKKQLHINEIPEKFKSYFETPLEVTRSELLKLRKKYLEKQPNDETIRSFLESKRRAIIEKAQSGLQEVKKVAGHIQESAKIEAKKMAEGQTEGKKAESFLENALDTANRTIEKTGNSEIVKKGKEKAEQTVKKAKEVTKSGVEAVKKSKTFIDFIDSLEKLKEKGGLGGFFATLVLFILGIFGFSKEKLKKSKEKIEKLNEKQIEQTKKYISDFLIKQFPEKKDYIQQTINNPKIFTEEKLQYFYKKLKAGEKITLQDLKDEFRELDIQKLLKEKSEKLKKELYKRIISEIETKYHKKLSPDQKEKAIELINKYLGITPDSIENIENRITGDRQLQIKDITPILGELGGNVLGFMLGLISEDIIDISDIGMTFVNAGMDVIKVSLSTLGLGEIIKIDDLYKNIDKLNEEQKSILLALLYRKGGLFLSTLGYLTSTTSKLILETILPTNSGVDGIKLMKDSLLHGNLKQVENFEKIEKALIGAKEETLGSKYLKEAVNNLKEVKRNFILLDILEKSNGNIEKFYSLLNNFEKTNGIKFNLEKFNNFEELQQGLAKKVKIDFATNFKDTFRGAKNKYIGFGIESAIQDFNRNLEKITVAQARIALGKVNLNVFKKLTETINIGKVSKLSDSLVFELRSQKDAKVFLKQLNELAKKSPELLKGIFDKLPIIAVAGLSINSQEGFFKSIEHELKDLMPLVGPVLMIGEGGIDWNSFPPKIIRPEQTAIAGALFTMDGYFLWKEKGVINKFKYLIKPISDIYDIGKGTVKTGQKLYKTIRVLGPKQAVTESGEIITKALSRAKKIKGPALVKAIGVTIIALITAEELAFADENDKNIFKDYIKENGELDLEKIMKEKEKLTDEQKQEIIKFILENLLDNSFKNLEIKVNNNKLNIISSNPNIKSDWFMTNQIKETIFNITGITDYNFEYKE